MNHGNRIDDDEAIERIRTTLRQQGKLGPRTVITRAVTIVQTVTEHSDGTQTWDIHRAYPLGAVDPSCERGMLRDALLDSDAERHPPTF